MIRIYDHKSEVPGHSKMHTSLYFLRFFFFTFHASRCMHSTHSTLTHPNISSMDWDGRVSEYSSHLCPFFDVFFVFVVDNVDINNNGCIDYDVYNVFFFWFY